MQNSVRYIIMKEYNVYAYRMYFKLCIEKRL